MGFLDPEKEAEMMTALLDNNEVIDEESLEVSQVDETEVSSASPDEDDNEVQGSSSEPEEETGHNVPYSRFQQVIHARNHLREEGDELRAQLAALQQQLEQQSKQATPPPTAKKEQETYEDWIETIFDDDEVSGASQSPESPNYSTLEQKIYELEVHKETLNLQNEIKTVQEVYPDVPEEVLLQAVIQDPDLNVMDVAERYNTFISDVEERAIARYASEHTAPPAAPPRPSSAGQATSSFQGAKKPRTLDEAKKATLAYLKSL